MGKIKQAFELDPNLKNLLLDPFFKDAVHNSQAAWRKVVASSAMLGIPTPAFSTALAFYDSYRSARLPANLLQVLYYLNWENKIPLESTAISMSGGFPSSLMWDSLCNICDKEFTFQKKKINFN